MGLPWHATSFGLLSMVASATHSEALPHMTEGTIFVTFCSIIGQYIDFLSRKVNVHCKTFFLCTIEVISSKILISIK